MVFRASPALLGLALASGLASGLACSTNTHVQLETYGDEAAEDYGCIVGDLGCECLAGDVCDGGLSCVDDLCRCVEGPCKEMPPVTTEESDSGTDTGSDSGTESGTDSTDTGSTSDTTDTTDTDTTDTTESETSTDTDTETSTDSGSETGTT
jgi:hypothetical protein